MGLWFNDEGEIERDLDKMQKLIGICIASVDQGNTESVAADLHTVHAQIDHLKKLIKKIKGEL